MKEREYIVTLHNYEDLDSFYEDMETPGGNLYIPNRRVTVAHRRPSSRNTHYMLTDREAEMVKNDPRVLSVELDFKESGVSIVPSWTQTSNLWNKSSSINSLHTNWGLLRVIEGQQRLNWGSDGITTVTGTAKTTSSGKNVDVVIVDGHMDPNHPEFAVNSDGTGGSRVNQFNWFSLNPEVLGTSPTTYLYTPYVDNSNNERTTDNDHGAHVAGIMAGNTCGWARDANIYNINPYSSAPSPTSFLIDYIRQWHRTKPINPITGRRNPTITNHSYEIIVSLPITQINSIRFRGVLYNGPFIPKQLPNYGIPIFNILNIALPVRSIAYEQDLLDAINDGIIVVGAAGNSGIKIANYSNDVSDDYNNYVVRNTGSIYYYMRGSLAAGNSIICVGGISSSVSQTKLSYSNCGPRIDLYAPGQRIISSVNSSNGVVASDVRNSSYKLAKFSGTSMAAPHVAGVIACLAETQQRLTQQQAIEYITSNAKVGQLTSTNGGLADTTDLLGSTNRYLYYQKERQEQGLISPALSNGIRPNSGMVFPRAKIYRYGT